MRRSDRDRLLREILADESIERLREASLQRGLVALRTRRRRRVLVPVTTAAIAAAAVLAIVSVRHGARDPQPILASRSKMPPVKVIDDRELLALFAGRPVALVGAPGNQQLIFLDGAPGAATRSKYP